MRRTSYVFSPSGSTLVPSLRYPRYLLERYVYLEARIRFYACRLLSARQALVVSKADRAERSYGGGGGGSNREEKGGEDERRSRNYRL